MLTLVLGGARSGKSSFAEQIAEYRGGEDVIYLATAEIKDDEMAQRVEVHQQRRPASWQTIEEPVVVDEVLSKMDERQVVLLDCITVLLSNLYFKNEDWSADQKEKMILKKMEQMINEAREKEIDLIMVSNEVGLGIVPAQQMGRVYRDLAGKVNQLLARESAEVYFVCAGLPVEIKERGVHNLQKFSTDKKQNGDYNV